MSDSIIIQHLMSGINPEFRKELSRHQSCMNSLDEFLKYTKIEQDLYDTFEKTHQLTIESNQSQFTNYHSPNPSVATTIRQPTNQQYYTSYHNNSTESSMKKWNSFPQHHYQSRISTNKAIQLHEHNSYLKTAYFNQQSVPNSRFNNC
ncbi:unnamed protein product [Rotaria magnacalcarata]|nr:unnamed protein product [Rotaria magnacalcarata]CAF4068111.1 unnamed protein product [Rotaria magnacalcarata]